MSAISTSLLREDRAIVLLSGGLDSAANLAIAAEMGVAAFALTVDYGQRARERELDAAKKLCRYYEVSHQQVDLSWLGKLGGSALTDFSSQVPKLETEELSNREKTGRTARNVWVPNRNGLFVNTAAAFADRIKANLILVGFNLEEAATFSDNSIEFVKRMNETLKLSSMNQVQLGSYTQTLNKKEIVEVLLGNKPIQKSREGKAETRCLEKPFPFEMVWSCYLGEENQCGECESCRRFSRALAKNQIEVDQLGRVQALQETASSGNRSVEGTK